MDSFRLASALVLSLALALAAGPASPNGRTPPRTEELVFLKATCEAKSGDVEVFRARVVDAKGAAQSLAVRTGDATEQVAIRDVKAIAFTSDRADKNGFAKAKLTREGDDADAPVLLRVRTQDGPLRLTGFKADGSDVRMSLLQCRKLSFAPQRQGDASPDAPARAKH